MQGADLSGAKLAWADLEFAKLQGANLAGVDLTRARLGGANLTGANLAGCNLTRADLASAIFFEAARRSDSDVIGLDQVAIDPPRPGTFVDPTGRRSTGGRISAQAGGRIRCSSR